MEIEEHEIVLDIPFDMHEDDWADLFVVYKSMDGWIGFSDEGTPYWFGFDDDEISLSVSVEESGFWIEAVIDRERWKKWVIEFVSKASEALGLDIKVIDTPIS